MEKEEVEKELKRKFKGLKKQHKLSHYNWKKALELYSTLQTEKGNLAIRKCIKAAIYNSERLGIDSEVVSNPTKSALLELAFEEASKAYWLSYIYLEIFEIENKPFWVDTDEFKEKPVKEKRGLISRSLLRIKLIYKITKEMNLLYSLFRNHDLKVLLPLIGTYSYYKIPNFEDKVIAILRRQGIPDKEIQQKLPAMREKIKLLSRYDNTDFNKIKLQGLYVDLNFKSLDIIEPKKASESKMEEMNRSMEISIRNAKSLLVALGDL